MSFLSVLKSIGHVLTIGIADVTPFVPVIAAIPVVGAPASLIISAIAAVEKLIPASGAGAAKKVAVTAIVNAASAPSIDPATLSAVIDEIVAAFNSLAASTAKVAPIPAA